ncbi:MAG: MFS transporter [Pseudonocardiaceae bacterium]
MTSHAERPASYREVFAVGEFRALFTAALLSTLGDQLARVALAVLVFDRTSSPALTTLTYLPELIAGPLLSGLADRRPRRALMVHTDIARAVLVALMAIPGTPFVILCAFLVLVQLLNAPFSAARAATLPAALTGDRYVVGSGVSNVANQLAQLVGFAFGGAMVALIGASPALLLNAASFLLSAALIRAGVRERPIPVITVRRPPWGSSVRAGALLVWRDRRLRALVALACVSGFYITAEGLAVPYAAAIGGGPTEAGLLLATAPTGAAIGMVLLSRFVSPAARLRWMGPMAALACVPLLPCVWYPGWEWTILLWALSGAASAYHLTANAEFVRAVPNRGRGQAFGLAVTALRMSQGVGILLAGLAAESEGPGPAISLAGLLGVLAAVGAGAAWQRANQTDIPAPPG